MKNIKRKNQTMGVPEEWLMRLRAAVSAFLPGLG
jgi:hypothetical protein